MNRILDITDAVQDERRPDSLLFFNAVGTQVDELPWRYENPHYAHGFIDAMYAHAAILADEAQRLHSQVETALLRWQSNPARALPTPARPPVEQPPDRLVPFERMLAAELVKAMRAHPPCHSAHEAYAVIKEELDEFWEEVREREQDPEAMLRELVQIAQTAMRTAHDVVLPRIGEIDLLRIELEVCEP